MARSPDAPTLVSLIAAGTLDASLAGLVWLLLEHRVPLLVAAAAPLESRRQEVRDALADLAMPGLRRVGVDRDGAGLAGLTASDTGQIVLIGLDLPAAPSPAIQIAFKALARGADIVASLEGDSLEDVQARLRRLDIRLTDDELTFVGIVLVLRAVEIDGRPAERLTVAHYVRPLARDGSGHVQRLPPAVLATWDSGSDRFEAFWWGLAADLAGRVGLRPGDLDAEVERRSELLAGLAAAGVVERESVLRAAEGFRLSDKAPGAH